MCRLTVTERTYIMLFAILTMIAISGIVIAIKMKLPIWKFQIGWIILCECLGAFLLITLLLDV